MRKIPASLLLIAALAESAPCQPTSPAAAPAGTVAPAGSKPYENWNDLVCGPRCVQLLLEHYRAPGIDRPKPEDDLIEIIREVQGTEISKGSTMADLERTLRARKIAVRPIRWPPGQPLRWPHPVLLHLRNAEGLGHYVVWLRHIEPRSCLIWTGLGGPQAVNEADLTAQRGDVMLLTAPTEITDAMGDRHVRDAVRSALLARLQSASGIVVAVLLATILLLSIRSHRRQAGRDDARTGRPAT